MFVSKKPRGVLPTMATRGVGVGGVLRPKGVPFLAKMVYKSARGWTSGWSLPVEKIGKYPLYGAKNLLNDCRPLQTVWFKKKAYKLG